MRGVLWQNCNMNAVSTAQLSCHLLHADDPAATVLTMFAPLPSVLALMSAVSVDADASVLPTESSITCIATAINWFHDAGY